MTQKNHSIVVAYEPATDLTDAQYLTIYSGYSVQVAPYESKPYLAHYWNETDGTLLFIYEGRTLNGALTAIVKAATSTN